MDGIITYMKQTEIIDTFNIGGGDVEYRLLSRNNRIIWQERHNTDPKPRFRNVLSFHGKEMPAYWNFKKECGSK